MSSVFWSGNCGMYRLLWQGGGICPLFVLQPELKDYSVFGCLMSCMKLFQLSQHADSINLGLLSGTVSVTLVLSVLFMTTLVNLVMFLCLERQEDNA